MITIIIILILFIITLLIIIKNLLNRIQKLELKCDLLTQIIIYKENKK